MTLNFDLSRSLNVKCDGGIGLTICGFLLMFKSIIWPNSAAIRDIRLQDLSDLDFDFQGDTRSNVMVPFLFHAIWFLINV